MRFYLEMVSYFLHSAANPAYIVISVQCISTRSLERSLCYWEFKGDNSLKACHLIVSCGQHFSKM